jgi:four helix bundle protein
MSTSFEDLRVLKSAEEIADAVWKRVSNWEDFPKDVVGKQIARATDSIGANIAESFGRFNFGEKLQFLYYARGSLFETKYWLNRAKARELMPPDSVQEYTTQLTNIARQLNAFAESLKTQRSGGKTKTIRELAAEYKVDLPDDFPETLFDDSDLNWLEG